MMTKRQAATPAPGLLEDYATAFDDLFERRNAREGFRRYLEGLLLPAERNKTLTALANAEPIVGIHAPPVQALQWFLGEKETFRTGLVQLGVGSVLALRPSHAWWALEVMTGPYGPHRRERAVVATTAPATLSAPTTWYLVTNLPAPDAPQAPERSLGAATMAEVMLGLDLADDSMRCPLPEQRVTTGTMYGHRLRLD